MVWKWEISLDDAIVNPHIFYLFGQEFMESGADQKLFTWEDGHSYVKEI